MATQYIYRVVVIVPAVRRAVARQAMVDGGPGGEAERGSFVAELSVTGSAPATHYGACTSATLALRNKIDTLRTGGVVVYVYDALTYELQATNSPTASGRLGEVWDWRKSISDMGLQVIYQLPVLEQRPLSRGKA